MGCYPYASTDFCKENRIEGANRMSRIWVILEGAEKPTGTRKVPDKSRN